MDNLLTISLDVQSIVLEVAEKLKFNKDKIDPPEVNLGGRLAKKSLNGQDIWTILSVDYFKAKINNIKVMLKKEGMKLLARAEIPMSSD